MLSIVIPSRNEKFLKRTILDVLEKATGEIEVFPVLDGYDISLEEIVNDPRVQYITLPSNDFTQKRHGINKVVNEFAKGEYIMCLDAHCMVAPGFDEQLIKDHQPNWVQVPRRHRLDAENWCLQKQSDNRPPIDYEYIKFDTLTQHKIINGFKWDVRTLERMDVPIDDTMTIQASMWFMTKEWFNKMGFMQIDGYTGWGQEAEEICMTTWKNGGAVKTNKNTWYAHLHKGNVYGRMYWMNKKENKRSFAYSYNHWVIENKKFFVEYIQKFNPPWPKDWQEKIYGTIT
jgi:hypothetical protein